MQSMCIILGNNSNQTFDSEESDELFRIFNGIVLYYKNIILQNMQLNN